MPLSKVCTIAGRSNGRYVINVSPLRVALNVGAILRIEEVNRVSLIGEISSELRDFVVTTNAKRGDKKVSIYPRIVSRGKNRTVSKAPKAGAKVSEVTFR